MKSVKQFSRIGTFVLIFAASTCLNAQVWTPQTLNLPLSADMNFVKTVNPSTAWAIGWFGDYSGQSWNLNEANHGGYIVHTNDNGAHWSVCKPMGVDTQLITSIAAVSFKQAWVLAFDDNIDFVSKLYRTRDGGNTWQDKTPLFKSTSSFGDVVHFWNANKGVLIGDNIDETCHEIYTTDDGGDTWKRVPCANITGNGASASSLIFFYDIKATPQGDIYYCANSQDGSSHGYVAISHDFGKSWKINDSAIKGGDFVAFRNTSVGLSVATNYDVYPFQYAMSRTRDGGNTWTDITPTNNNFGIYDLQVLPNTNTFIATTRGRNDSGPFGTIISTDDGATWRTIEIGTPIQRMSFAPAEFGTQGFGGRAANAPTAPATMMKFNMQNVPAGALSESNLTIPTLKTLPTNAARATPNPFHDDLTLTLNLPKDATDIAISLTDITGRAVFAQKHSNTEGVESLNIETANLPTGNYTLRVVSNKGVWTEKLVKF